MGEVPLEERFTHFPPNAKQCDNIGVLLGNELLSEGVIPTDLKLLFSDDVVPDLHPLILYRVADMASEGDIVIGASVSLNDFDSLVVGRYHFYAMRGKKRRDPTLPEIEKVKEYLSPFLGWQYSIDSTNEEGLKIKKPVNAVTQIMNLMSEQAEILFSPPK